MRDPALSAHRDGWSRTTRWARRTAPTPALRNLRIGYDVVIAHTRGVFVHEGDRVRKGMLIARASDDGGPDGCHLHFERRAVGGGLATAAGPCAARPDSEGVSRTVDDHDSKVLGHFLTPDGRLRTIPTKRSKLLVVLDHLSQSFEPGRHYPKDVNEILEHFHPDYAALRRYLVEDQFLTREEGVYWRSGGVRCLRRPTRSSASRSVTRTGTATTSAPRGSSTARSPTSTSPR